MCIPWTTWSRLTGIVIRCCVGVLCAGSLPVSASDDHAMMFGVAVRTSALESRFCRERTEEQPVSTSLLNTNVTGTQSTVTKTRLRFVPDDRFLKFELLNSGDVTSVTTGVNRRAVIDSAGSHHFEVVKPLWFDGNTFTTSGAHGTISAMQTPQRVQSAVGMRMPALGQFGDRVAWNQVVRRQPEINMAVAEDVSRDVLPKIDRYVDSEFVHLGEQWKQVQLLAGTELRPSRLLWKARSTESVAAIWALETNRLKVVEPGEIPAACRRFTNNDDILVCVSERAVQQLISRYVPSGLKITDTQLQAIQALVQPSGNAEDGFSTQSLAGLKQILSGSPADASKPASLFSIELAEADAVRVRFVGGDVQVTVRFQVHSSLSASSGWMSTTLRLHGKRLNDDQWTIAVRGVDVGESSTDSGIAGGAANPTEEPLLIPQDPADFSEVPADVTTVQAGTAWVPIIRTAVEGIVKQVPQVPMPLQFEGIQELTGDSDLRLVRIEANDGRLTIGLRMTDPAPNSPVAGYPD
jgi:hypothetical protein